MKNHMKVLLIFTFIFTLALTSFVTNTESVMAATCPDGATVNTNGQWVDPSTGDAITVKETIKDCQDASKDLEGKVLRFVKILSTLVVVFAVGMIVYGGFKYIASQGDPRKAEEAKTQILYAGVGLFIVLAAFTILQLFIQASGGTV